MSGQTINSKDGPEELTEELKSPEKMVLLLLSAAHEKAIPGNLWLQKELFYVSDSLPDLREFLDYEPHLQGPYSETVNNLAEDLQYLGLVERDRKGLRLTERGRKVAEIVEDGTNKQLLDLISDSKEKLNDLSKDELLVYIYYTNPEMTTESIEKEGLEPKRSSVAVKLYERGKVDLEKGAELAGLSVESFKQKIASE